MNYTFLEKLKNTIDQRSKEYGDPYIFAKNLSERFSNVINTYVSQEKAILMMLEMKLERAKNILNENRLSNNTNLDIEELEKGEFARDTILDIAGYAFILDQILNDRYN